MRLLPSSPGVTTTSLLATAALLAEPRAHRTSATAWRALHSLRCCEANRPDPPLAWHTEAATFAPLTEDGGLQKAILRAADDDDDGEAPSEPPPWGAVVSIYFTGRFTNGTVFDDKSSTTPYEFQLNTNEVVDGMERGVKSMRPGEIARLICSPRWAYGNVSIGSKIPRNATLVYDVELRSWKDGPPIENTDFDMETYRASLEGKAAGAGQTRTYTWSEHGEDVTLCVPLDPSEGARDIRCEIYPKRIDIRVGSDGDGDAAASGRVEVAGQLKGTADAEESYWVIEEEEDSASGVRELQVVLVKAGAFTRWDGVLIGEDE